MKPLREQIEDPDGIVSSELMSSYKITKLMLATERVKDIKAMLPDVVRIVKDCEAVYAEDLDNDALKISLDYDPQPDEPEYELDVRSVEC